MRVWFEKEFVVGSGVVIDDSAANDELTMTVPLQPRTRKAEHGFSLLELLVTLSLLSISLLSLHTMQLTALKEAKIAYYFRSASEELEIMNKRLKCINDDGIDQEIAKWNEQIKMVLPNGRGGMIDKQKLLVQWGEEGECRKIKIGVSGCLVL